MQFSSGLVSIRDNAREALRCLLALFLMLGRGQHFAIELQSSCTCSHEKPGEAVVWYCSVVEMSHLERLLAIAECFSVNTEVTM